MKSLLYKPEYSSGNGTNELNKILGSIRSFSNPKPLNLIFDLLDISTTKNATILDFFAGFRVIIMTVANSQVNIRVLELLPKIKTLKMNNLCVV